MKCDELKQVENPIEWGLYYDKAEVDEAIDELKKKLMPCLNGDCILTCEVVEKYGKENAELKAENERLKKQSSCTFSDDSLRVRQLKRKIADNSEKILELQKALDVALSEVYSLLDKIESLKASHYAEMVDAGMRERRLRRALWLARAEWARSSALSYHLIESHPDKDAAATYKRKANKWEKVKDKCLKKAEEYK